MGYYAIANPDLQHFGVKGQKWGVRRYQNEDGSLKPGATSTSSHGKHKYEKSYNYRQRAIDAKSNIKVRKNAAINTYMKADSKAYSQMQKARQAQKDSDKKYKSTIKDLKSQKRNGSIDKATYKEKKNKAIEKATLADSKNYDKVQKIKSDMKTADKAYKNEIKSAKKDYKQAKKDYKKSVKSNYKQQSLKNKVFKSKSARKNAAKLMSQGINEKDAFKIAKRRSITKAVLKLGLESATSSL